MNYDDVQLGAVLRCGDCKDLIGDELTFAQLVRESGTSKLLLWMGATVGGDLTDDSEFLVCQIVRVEGYDPEVDTEDGDEEWATVLFDIPGFSSKPVQLEFEDFEAPEIEDGDDPNAMHNQYHRIWRMKKALQPLEHLAIGAAIYSKCKANLIDSTEDLLEAFRTGQSKRIFSTPQISQIRTVLGNAKIAIPETTANAEADPDERTKLLWEDLLQHGTGFENGKQRVADFYEKNRPADSEFAEFLKKEYGCRGHSGPKMPDVSYDSKGIHIRTADRARAYNYTWLEAAKEIRSMIDSGEYLTEKQETAIVEAAPAEPSDPWTRAKALHQRIVNDAQTAAESIWDMAQAIKEMRDGKHYKALLYDNFEGYCENALGMSRAHAYRYITIAEGMTAEKVAAMRQIGTTKLALLATVTEEDQQIITTAVDVDSATVKELKAEIDKLKGRAEKAEQEKDKQQRMREEILTENAEMSDRISSLLARVDELESDEALEKAQMRIKELVAEKQQHADRKEMLDAADNQIKRLNAEIANNSDYIGKLQAKIKELENRPVEVAVQEDTEAMEQLRKEYEAKLAEQEENVKKLEDELNQRDDNDHFLRLDINYREARVKVQTLCTMVANLNECKEKETLKQNIRNIIHDIEQRIGKE